ncbi:hypothetical protein BKA61DRAFT_666416 [Leptodontidium sp. MPI-SDFR-AT-0119]|nr:hypothetical protein BKA61DRAFT_666416 [Leptodontidium sp. MPI-SDFR-AT-0119]
MVATTSSDIAVNGSAEEFAPAPTSPSPKTAAQVAEDTALATGRFKAFIADTSLPVVAPVAHDANDASIVVSRVEAVAARVNAFNAAFYNTITNNNGGGQKHNGNK